MNKVGQQRISTMSRDGFIARCSWLMVLLIVGCKSPFDRTRNASGPNNTGAFGAGNFVIFSDELKTGGGAFEYPGGENQSLSFKDTSNPISHQSIRYSWNGGDVSSQFGPQHTFAGFDLMHTVTLGNYSTTPGRDLRQANYTKVTFFARGSLSTNTLLKVQAPDNGTGTPTPPCLSLSSSGMLDDNSNQGATPCGHLGTLTSSWQQYTLTISNPQSLAAVKDFFKATFIYNQGFTTGPGQGGVVYFDQIQYQP